MAKPLIYVLDTYYPDAIEKLKSSTSISFVYKDPEVENWRSKADGIMIRRETRITGHDLSQAKNLKVIIKQGVGVDNVDLEAAKAHGIAVCNTPALNSEAVAELTLTLALSVARRVNELDRRVRSGENIVRANVLGRSLHGKKIGVVGMGHVGRAVARKWRAMMEGPIIGYDPLVPKGAWKDLEHHRADSLEELLRQADVVSLHVPLNDSTRHMIRAPHFEQMKKSAIFINCARGEVIDEVALLRALESQTIWGAGLDAMTVEPPTLKAYPELLECGNVVMTPHIGGNTVENQIISGKAAAEAAIAFFEGIDLPNRVV